MSSSASRGAVLVAIAALLAFLILRGAADNTQLPVAENPVVEVTPTAAPAPEVEPDDTVDVGSDTIQIDPALARNNSEVRVLVANGTDESGQAGRLTSALRNQGFATREPRNADAQAASTIFYRPGFAAEAVVVRDILTGSTPIAPMPDTDPLLGEGIDLSLVDVLVLVGDDDLSTS